MPLKTLSFRSSKLFRQRPSKSTTCHSNSTATAPSSPSMFQQHHHLRHDTRPRTMSTPVPSTTMTGTALWTQTLDVMARHTKQARYDDVVASFFFTDRRCQQRALFFAARLKQTLPMLTATAWDHVIDRLYTWTYLMHVVPADDPWRWRYVMALEQLVVASPPQLAGIGHENDAPGKESGHLMWAFAVHQVMQLFAIEMSAHHQHQTQATLLHALVSEAKLTPADRDAMYLYHALRAGFAIDRVWTMQLPDDPHLLAKLEALQSANSNPFEDSACIVVDP